MTKPFTWPGFNPGRMRHQIQLQAQSTVPDSFGQPQQSWTTVLTTYASIEPVRGLDVIASGQETMQLILTVTIPWQTGVRADMRVLTADGETFIIQSIEDPARLHTVLILNCLEPRADNV